jgi:hypothetical protein
MPPHRTTVDVHVGRRRHLAAGSLRELREHFGIPGDVDDLEAVAGAAEEAPGAPAGQRGAAGVEDHLPLVHVVSLVVCRGHGRKRRVAGASRGCTVYY